MQSAKNNPEAEQIIDKVIKDLEKKKDFDAQTLSAAHSLKQSIKQAQKGGSKTVK